MSVWKPIVRERLPVLNLPPAREAEIIEEIAQILEDAAESTTLDLAEPLTRELWLNEQVPNWGALASELDHKKILGSRVARRTVPNTQANSAGKRSAGGKSAEKNSTEGKTSRLSPLFDIGRDLRHSFRLLAKAPGFTAVAILTLAIGIGFNTAMFSLVNYTLLKPVAVEDPATLVRVYSREPGGFLPEEPMAFPDYEDLAKNTRTLTQLAAHTMSFVAIERDGTADLTFGELATGNYFEMLGIAPVLGRFFGTDDDQIASPNPVVVLSYKTWQNRFGGDEEVVGQNIRINGTPLTVVGVAPASYVGLWPSIEPEVFAPLSLRAQLNAESTINSGASSDLDPRDSRHQRWLWVTGRRAGSLEATRDELSTLAESFAKTYPDTNDERSFVVVANSKVRISPSIDAGLKTGSLIVMIIVSLVLFIACANVANMLMARALGRRQEIATRLALGASRWIILRQLVVESLLLAVGGGLLGLLLAAGSNAFINRISLPEIIPMEINLTMDWRVLSFTFLTATATALVFGLLPALQASRADLNSVLREGDPRLGGGKRQRVQGALVIAQICLSLALLICAGLSLRSMVNAGQLDPGFEPAGLVTFGMDPMLQGEDATRTQQIYEEVTRELSSLPTVTAVTTASSMPLSLMINSWQMAAEGQEHLDEKEWPEVDVSWVGDNYFETMKISLVEGRPFTQADRPAEGHEPNRVAVVNQTMADRLWPEESAIGKRVRSSGAKGEWYQIVGVVANGKYRTLGEDPRPFLYQSIEQSPQSARFVITQIDSDAEKGVPMIGRSARAAAPGMALSSLGTAEKMIAPSRFLPRMGARLFGIFGVLGLFLSAIGLYAVLSYLVGQRTHEIGIRIAMGADRGDIVGLVLRRGAQLVAIGVVAGLGLAFLITRILSVILYGISSTDPLTFFSVTLFLICVSLFACWLPARRASAVDPLTALRHD